MGLNALRWKIGTLTWFVLIWAFCKHSWVFPFDIPSPVQLLPVDHDLGLTLSHSYSWLKVKCPDVLLNNNNKSSLGFASQSFLTSPDKDVKSHT